MDGQELPFKAPTTTPANEHAARGPLIQVTADGIYLPEADLWLDPLTAKPRAFISHAHADHARARHDWAVATPATHALMECRDVGCHGPALDYGESLALGDCSLHLESAGHVLGSAQLVLDSPRGRLVYTGDCKLRPSRVNGPTASPIVCDTLIIEATFALPMFRFPATTLSERRLVELARESLAAGRTPVFLGYSLGKGPEIAKVLSDHDLPVRVWGSMVPLLRVYERFGHDFEAVLRCTADAPTSGACWVVPPSARRHAAMSAIRQKRVIYVSGWASLDSGYDRMDADVLVPMSDHFDWPQIEAYIEASSPSTLLSTHGYTEHLARWARTRGIVAKSAHIGYGLEEAE